jgi:hypothetical protein
MAEKWPGNSPWFDGFPLLIGLNDKEKFIK